MRYQARKYSIGICAGSKTWEQRGPVDNSEGVRLVHHEPATQETDHVSAPPRIDSNSNVSVRKQQWLVKAKKASEAATHKVPYKQTFRKSKLDPEQRAEEARRQAEAEEIAQKAFKKSPLASLQNLYGLNGTERPPVLLVDGYNVLHMYVQHMQDSHSDSAMAAAQAFEDSRIGLESAMITYSQSRRIKVVIVYDAINRLPDPVYVDIRTSTRTTIPGAIDVVFCSDQSADSWIVKEVETIRREGKVPHVLVATDDNEITSSARSKGGYQVPCRDLIGEILKTELEMKEKMSSGHVTVDQLAYNIRSKYSRPLQRKPRQAPNGRREQAQRRCHQLVRLPQGAPADGYNKSDNNQVAAQPATLGPEVTYSQIDAAAAASNTGPIHPQGQVTNPSEGPSERDTSSASDPHTGTLMAGGISPQNALDPAPRSVPQNILAAMSKHSQVPLATITENTELEQPSSSAP
ncbi:hypothetical protein WJX79_006591 [Trebouxia sp. C0005]